MLPSCHARKCFPLLPQGEAPVYMGWGSMARKDTAGLVRLSPAAPRATTTVYK